MTKLSVHGPASAAESEGEIARDVGEAKAGNAAAMTNLYRRFGPVIHGILLTRVGYPEADDLTQEVFMRAMRSLSTLQDPAALGAWLCTIARNEAARLLKQKGTTRLKLAGLAHESHARKTGAEGAQRALEAREALAAIRALPDAYRETLVLRLVEGLTGPEIAARTGMTHGSVRVNLTRGMKLLRESFGEREGA